MQRVSSEQEGILWVLLPAVLLVPEPSVEHMSGFRVAPRWGSVGPRGLCFDLPPPGVPATLATRRASWFLDVLERFWLRCLLPVERVLRRWTSVALKKATMKGCLFWGPCRPIRPANLGLMLCPRPKAARGIEERLEERPLAGGCIRAHSSLTRSLPSGPACIYSALNSTPGRVRRLEHPGEPQTETPVPGRACQGGRRAGNIDRRRLVVKARSRGSDRSRAEVCRRPPAPQGFPHISLGIAGPTVHLIPRGGRSPARHQGG